MDYIMDYRGAGLVVLAELRIERRVRRRLVGVHGRLVLVLVVRGRRRGGRRTGLADHLRQAEHLRRGLRRLEEGLLEHVAHRGDLDDILVHAEVEALAVVGTLALEGRVLDDRGLRAAARVLVELHQHVLARLVALDAGQDDQLEGAVAVRVARLGLLQDEAAVLRLGVRLAVHQGALADEAGVVGVLEPATGLRAGRRLLRRAEAAIAVHHHRVTDLLVRAIEGREQGRDRRGVANGALLAPHLLDGPARVREDILGREDTLGGLHEPLEDRGLLDLIVRVLADGLRRLPEGCVGRRHGLVAPVVGSGLVCVASDTEAQDSIPRRVGKPESENVGNPVLGRGFGEPR